MSQFVYFIGSWHDPIDFGTRSDDPSTTIVGLALGGVIPLCTLVNVNYISEVEVAMEWMLRHNVKKVPCFVEVKSDGECIMTEIPMNIATMGDIRTLSARAVENYNDNNFNDAAKW